MRVDLSGVGAVPRDEGAGDLRQAAERFAALARRGGFSQDPQRFEPALARLAALLSRPFPDLPPRLAASLALGLDAAARALPGPMRETAFACLASSGRFGTVLAASCVSGQILAGDAASRALAGLSPSVGLAVANHILLEAGPRRSGQVDWALAEIDRLRTAGCQELRPLLRQHVGSVPGLAHPVRQALLQGGPGRDIRGLNPARASRESLREAAEWLRLLGQPADPPAFAPVLAVQGDSGLACRFLSLLPGQGGGRTFSAILSSARPEQAPGCLEAALAAAPDKAPAIAAMLARSMPGALAHLARASVLMPAVAREEFLAALGPGLRPSVALAELARVAEADPAGAALAASLAGCPETAAWLGSLPGQFPEGGQHEPVDAPEGGGACGSFLQEGDRTDRREFSLRSLIGLPPARPRGGELLGLAQRAEGGLTATGRVFQDESFKGKSLEGGRYRDCRFLGTDFGQACLTGAEFTGCSFVGCLFEKALPSGSLFEDCLFEGCSFAGASLDEARLTRCAVARCSFSGARLSGASLDGSVLEWCDLSGITARELSLRGAALRGCLLDRAWVPGLDARSARTLGAQARQARLEGLLGVEPFLMKVREKSLRRGLGQSRPGEDPPVPAGQAEATVAAWSARQEALGRLRAHAAENARRLAVGRALLGPGREDIVRLIPFLLHTESFDQAEGIYPMAPPCRIEGYHPGLGDLDAARRHFPEAALPDPSSEALAIEGVHTIGSFGTLAQTAGSDLDVWVLIRPGHAAESDLEGLALKLSAMERFLHHAYGVEAHFYLMDMERVAANDFGVSHEEGSGSAQAMLLKEEFYRTGVVLAGKPPLWWAAPVGCDDKRYRSLARDPEFAAGLCDLGRIGDIPGDEFFGASLWQIFKSIGSPYKSVMKIGLLERYASGEAGQGAGLLCESIKASLLSGSPDPWDLDPYARLFTEVHGHYLRQGMREDAALIRLAFLAKSELAAKAALSPRPLTPQEERSLEMLQAMGVAASAPGGEGGAAKGFRQRQRTGELLGRFVVRAYTRLADRAGRLGGTAITPEDLTRLGRRIVAAFSRRPRKVEVMPFTQAGDLACKVLYVSAARGEKNEYIWRIQAGESLPGEARLDIVLTREGRDLGALLAWLAANGVYGSGTQVSADYTINPVTAKDIQEYLAELSEFFPKEGILLAGTAGALEDEAVAKALVAVNLTRPREAAEVAELMVAWQTNWGELFVRTVRPRSQPPYDAVKVLGAVSGLACSPDLEVRWFKPARAACPAPFPEREA